MAKYYKTPEDALDDFGEPIREEHYHKINNDKEMQLTVKTRNPFHFSIETSAHVNLFDESFEISERDFEKVYWEVMSKINSLRY